MRKTDTIIKIPMRAPRCFGSRMRISRRKMGFPSTINVLHRKALLRGSVGGYAECRTRVVPKTGRCPGNCQARWMAVGDEHTAARLHRPPPFYHLSGLGPRVHRARP